MAESQRAGKYSGSSKEKEEEDLKKAAKDKAPKKEAAALEMARKEMDAEDSAATAKVAKEKASFTSHRLISKHNPQVTPTTIVLIIKNRS